MQLQLTCTFTIQWQFRPTASCTHDILLTTPRMELCVVITCEGYFRSIFGIGVHTRMYRRASKGCSIDKEVKLAIQPMFILSVLVDLRQDLSLIYGTRFELRKNTTTG